jgi:hypothetical protein
MLSPKRKPTQSKTVGERPTTAAQPRVAKAGSLAPTGVSDDAQVLKEVTIHDIEPGAFYIGSWQGIVMVRWEKTADADAVLRLGKVSTALVADQAYPRRSNVHIISESAGVPSASARAGFVDLMKEHADRMACVCIVVEGSGFLASAMRSFLTGMRLLAPRAFQYRLFGTVEDVVAWLPAEHRARTGEEIDTRRFAQVLANWAKAESKLPKT